jgi:hypothetical protein
MFMKRWSHVAQVSSNRPAKFKEPAPHCFIGDIQTTLCKQILYISKAQSEPGVEPNGVANDVRWKAMAFKADFLHPARLNRIPNSGQSA